ncbi:MAG: ABC transporter substrate-binding protein [Pyrinomonadaceae bacterium]
MVSHLTNHIRCFKSLARIGSLLLALQLAISPVCLSQSPEPPGTVPIRIGLFFDMTGRTASFGVASVNGIRMATDEINQSGGVLGRPIELIVLDDEGFPADASRVVRKLINEYQVVALLGEVASTNSLAAAPHAQSAKIPMITPSSTNPKVTMVGDYIFRTCFIDPFQGTAMAQFARNTLRAKTAAILGDVNSDYSNGLAHNFEAEFKRRGGRIISSGFYTQDDLDFKVQLRKIRAARPDVIYLPGYYSEAGSIIKQARELGMRQPVLGGDGWDSPQLFGMAGDALNNTYISNHYATDDPDPRVKKFAADYRARFKEEPEALSALAYDSMKVLADAIRRAGSTDGPKLRDALARTKDFPGVTGNITIDADRNAVKPALILQIKNGGFVYKEKVFPPAPRNSGTEDSNDIVRSDRNGDANITQEDISKLPVGYRRPALSLRQALKIAEGYARKQKLALSTFYLDEARIILYGSEQAEKERRWYLHWTSDAPLGGSIEMTVSMDGKVAATPSM